MLTKGLGSEEVKNNTLKNLSTYTDLHAGAKDAELVVEAAAEIRKLNLSYFAIWMPFVSLKLFWQVILQVFLSLKLQRKQKEQIK